MLTVQAKLISAGTTNYFI